MKQRHTITKLTAVVAVTAVVGLGIGSSAAAKPNPSQGCTPELKLYGSGGGEMQIYRWSLCGRRVGPAFG